MSLREFLLSPRGSFDYAEDDCCRWVARWIVSQGHADPMPYIGHSYSTRIGALRVIRRGGGLVALWSKGMAGARLETTDTPIAGTVAVLSIPTDDGLNEACFPLQN
ncbi:MAG: hypothetical protein EOO77_35750 [Oxalobacteraceae bacterium]|nr:MAG: hypothetical protein EOO77_35750 [Oxalobacteraceae bacterium]